MKTFTQRTTEEQTIIRNAISFEIEAIKILSADPNPYRKAILDMEDGAMVWEAVNDYLSEWGSEAGLC